MKYTPGPWKVIEGSLDIVSCGDILSRRFIAEALESTIKSDNQPSVYVSKDLEVKSNARLIAACPDMYEALRILITVIQDQTKDLVAWDGAHFVDKAIDNAKAAIAKAEGR